MQIVLNAKIDADIKKKMSTLRQKALKRKFDQATLIENLIKDYEGVKNNIDCAEKATESCNKKQNKDGYGVSPFAEKEVKSTGKIEKAKNQKTIASESEEENEDDERDEESFREEKKPCPKSKLSNSLDILSDEEEEPPKLEKEKVSQKKPVADKQCIHIEDDDDIMLVYEDIPQNSKDSKKGKEEKSDKSNETKDEVANESLKKKITTDTTINVKASSKQEEISEGKVDNTINTENEETEEKVEINQVALSPNEKPLLPINFLETCKKNLVDMTRGELEEFCLMKIAEGVVDRSNLTEIKTQLKSMAQNLEESKRKAIMIIKQNRDLQVVLKSVQEEQKKHSDINVTPLKITRSVGMQVMTDKNGPRRKPIIGPNNINPNNKLNKFSHMTNKKSTTIPVPRLVPAVNNNNVNNKAPSGKQGSGSLLNGASIKSAKSPPGQKPEKRTPSKMQQNSSFTVDLTDDEPPTKQLPRNINPPVRLLSPQNLLANQLATQRPPFTSNINSPRKVYIPISGSQTQGVRPGQTYMVKTISPQQGPRQRMASTLMCKPSSNMRMPRPMISHPAPLPESLKQFEPPNWKPLPPAPELKLSKVENGIVISWKIDGYKEDNYEEIASFQLYAYQETTSPPSTLLWKKIGDVKALPLPMACTLTQFMAGFKYYFAVRAIDVRTRVGPFSEPGSILLLNKM